MPSFEHHKVGGEQMMRLLDSRTHYTIGRVVIVFGFLGWLYLKIGLVINQLTWHILDKIIKPFIEIKSTAHAQKVIKPDH